MHALAYFAILPLVLGAVLPADSYTTTPRPGKLVPGRYTVKFKDGTPVSVRDNILSQLDNANEHVDYNDIFVGFTKTMSETEVDLVRNDPNVEYVEQDRDVYGFGIVEQPKASWNLGRIANRKRGIDKYVYDETAGEGTCAYVIDTGVDDTHPDFGGRAKQIKSFVPGETTDGHGHGTHVAGILGSTTYGVAKQTRIFGVKVLDNNNQGYESRIIQGIDFVVNDQKKRRCPKGIVVNLSTGAAKSKIFNAAAAALVKTGVFFGAAAGNFNDDASNYSPGSDPSVCVVGGTDKDDKPFFIKGRGGQPDFATNFGARVDIFAPGQDIVSTRTGGGELTMSGTSQACPHVVGIAAYLASLEGITGTKPLCDRIRKLSTKNAIINQHPNTPNRLAFNGATLSSNRKPLCTEIKQLEFGIALSDDMFAGTNDEIGAILEGPAGKAEFSIVTDASRGFNTRVPVDMKASFGSDTIKIDGINSISLTAKGPWISLLTNDKWKVKDVTLHAKCAEPGLEVADEKYISLNAWYQHPDASWLPFTGHSKQIVAKLGVSRADWTMKPPCVEVKDITYWFQLGDKWLGGADGILSFKLGDGKRITIGENLDAGFFKSGTMDLKDIYGRDTMDLRDIKKLQIFDNVGYKGKTDEWFLQGIGFGATCVDGGQKVKLSKFGNEDEWLGDDHHYDDLVYARDIIPSDWVKAV
ncbi:hypothetical protein MHUMG1_07422 [Metarhizium humberi]|uniref:Peptidase S8/S53 domain-containing protein n=1 Tax=Metarhizium humberi TaxID=2596975 RepID=A0A9P8S5U1_9HYPO|nr:hypothetical protein MHUMG1_07422 [Metarhizium humberi]